MHFWRVLWHGFWRSFDLLLFVLLIPARCVSPCPRVVPNDFPGRYVPIASCPFRSLPRKVETPGSPPGCFHFQNKNAGPRGTGTGQATLEREKLAGSGECLCGLISAFWILCDQCAPPPPPAVARGGRARGNSKKAIKKVAAIAR